ncbi:hypothetical protein LG296_21200 (plasmid) [Ureibacillus chungkukjangi]|uniref:hypothetical protein n=1 Tax=Ureibacillus chungkukjangi TaxID=1202712 RepID=UPI000D36F3CD|nr:hypothetical protein [Ureibacillus chungkukjangi]MCM3390206.1 hypothetical protein [Ureibacillus chungkukjangi]
MVLLTRKSVNENIRLPIARISFKLDASVFKKVNDELERIPNTYITRNTIHDVIQIIHNNVFVLSTGEIVQDFPNNRATLTYGKLIIKDDGVKVFSVNGIYLRKVMKGQMLSVYEIIETENGMLLYKINDREVIAVNPNVEFIMGYFKPSKPFTAVYNGKPLKLNVNEKYAFKAVSGMSIALNDQENFWIDLSAYEGDIEIV